MITRIRRYDYTDLKIDYTDLEKHMRLFVTGGAGFIGSNFIRYWMQHHPGDTIVNFDKLTYAGNRENLQDVQEDPHYTFVYGDICDPHKVASAMRECDVVVHFAAESHVDRSIINPADFMLTNVVGTQVLLDAASRYKVQRFHHISTDEVFGHLGPNDPPFHESTPYAPRSPYAASKAAADHLVSAYYTTYGLPVTISHGVNNIGPYQYPEKAVPLFITNILQGKKIPLYGNGENIRSWVYVEDFCRGIALVTEQGHPGGRYCFGSTIELSNLQLAHKILEYMGKHADLIEYVKDRPGHDQRYAMSMGKVKRELGWAPQYSLDQALQATIDWYTNHTEWWSKLKNK